MSISNISAASEEFSPLKKEIIEFTDSDKLEVILALQFLTKSLDDNNYINAHEIDLLIFKLQNCPSDKALEYLKEYLNIENLTHISKIKSFMFIKQLCREDIILMEENHLLEKKLASHFVLSFLHNIFYKTLPCVSGTHCKYFPRRIVHKNDFADNEIECYFYHHEKDRRRLAVGNNEKEFRYAGNFADARKKSQNKNEFSQNFFESLYHPLYYKNFCCVRSKCEKSVFCPYYHSNAEKNVWGIIFKNFFGKDREIFTKKRNPEEEKSQKLQGKHSSQIFNQGIFSVLTK
jgi:hypothetical protein